VEFSYSSEICTTVETDLNLRLLYLEDSLQTSQLNGYYCNTWKFNFRSV